MTVKLIWKLVIKNFKALRVMMLPFILTSSVMFGLLYILISLINNDYIQHRHGTLPMLIGYANILIGLLTVIFIIYANRFVMKQRRQEFALDMILGLEKKHIRLMIFLEMLIQMIMVMFLSVLGGYLFGNIVFLMLNKLVKGSGITLMNYPFDWTACLITLLMIGGAFIILYLINMMMITRQSPVELMRSQQAGEKKAKKWLIVIAFIGGAAALSYGYYLALTATGIIDSLQTIFIAVLAVLIGTYLLFMSLTLLVLQWLQQQDSIYYRPKYFFSISGLISRMRSNAIGLASITMLMTFLIVTLGMTVTAYQGMENQVSGRMNQNYRIDIFGDVKVQDVKREVERYAQVDRYRTGENIMFPLQNINGDLKELNKDMRGADAKTMIYAVVTTQKSHNDLQEANVHLKDNEVVLSSNTERFRNYSMVKLAGQNVHVKHADKDFIGNQLAVDALYIIVKDDAQLEKIRQYYQSYDRAQKKSTPSDITTTIEFNIISGEKEFKKHIPEIQKKIIAKVENKEELKKMIYEMNGGLVFIGIVVSIVLLTGIFLMLYYKQLSEGYDDKANYMIMKKVGLPERLIKSTIHQQIFWVFGLPLFVAVIHTLFASKIIYQLLGVLGIRDFSFFLTSYGGVTIGIMMIYGLMYLITSRIYYGIINH